MKILIADDDPTTVNALRAWLVRCGYQVATATNAREALREINQSIEQSEPVELMVADFVMPGMNGLDLIRSARELLPRLSAVLITAYGISEIREEAMKLDCCAFVEKPFVPLALLKTIHEVTKDS